MVELYGGRDFWLNGGRGGIYFSQRLGAQRPIFLVALQIFLTLFRDVI